MPKFHIDNANAREVTDKFHLAGGLAKQVLACYHIAEGKTILYWEKLKKLLGGLFVQSKQVKIQGRIIKFKGQ